jgi:hypothetical protein
MDHYLDEIKRQNSKKWKKLVPFFFFSGITLFLIGFFFSVANLELPDQDPQSEIIKKDNLIENIFDIIMQTGMIFILISFFILVAYKFKRK